MAQFQCETCGAWFGIAPTVLRKYPGWAPKFCRAHSPKANKAGAATSRADRHAREENFTLTEVLQKYEGGPRDGLFTDGSCSPNPGPGGWGVVWVVDGDVVEQRHGRQTRTTNNRMELTALIEALRLVPLDASATVYTDSDLCVKTINQWAAGWARNGWKRRSGPIKNLELVQTLYALDRKRPNVKLTWIAAHQGHLWNEYADSLATAWMRETL